MRCSHCSLGDTDDEYAPITCAVKTLSLCWGWNGSEMCGAAVRRRPAREALESATVPGPPPATPRAQRVSTWGRCSRGQLNTHVRRLFSFAGSTAANPTLTRGYFHKQESCGLHGSDELWCHESFGVLPVRELQPLQTCCCSTSTTVQLILPANNSSRSSDWS